MIWQPGQTLEMVEQVVIQEAYRFYRQNKTQTASSLGISIRTLDTKLERYAHDDLTVRAETDELRRQRDEHLLRARGMSGTSNLSSSSPGMRMESAPENTAEPKMSVSERSQVQEVLPREVSQGSAKKAR